ncbi:MAG: phosphonate ABC transporter ATP-binding protein [Flavobacteriales bacterium]|nr:phosphonate ABC transporter ATP-binding protein [Flavobacteriales bacterium]|tara:strand:- start:18113 stop:18796 length:684 start_codon:yes stop_codon:yes gene_type:complete
MEKLVELKDIKAFHRKKQILNGVNIDVQKGEFVYLIGKTGSGKSSILKVLYKEMDIAEGEGEIVGLNLNKLKYSKVHKLRRQLGIIFQDFQLLPDRSVLDNLMFTMEATGWKDKKAMKSHADLTLEQVNLQNIGDKYPHQLSGGQQQKVAIARAMINSPKVILADEPTGNLDPESSQEIMNLLSAISKGGTAIIMATHDMDIVKRYPGRVLKCEEGVISEVQLEKHE